MEVLHPRKRIKHETVQNEAYDIKHKNKSFILLELPNEIICEVLQYLQPWDLLHLTRCSSLLRHILSSRSTRRIWDAAWLDIGEPTCPAGYGEIAYARFLLEEGCFGCGVKSRCWDSFHLQARYCVNCFHVCTGHAQDILSRAFGGGYATELRNDDQIYELAPSVYIHDDCIYTSENDDLDPSIRLYVEEDLIDIVAEYLKLDPIERPAFVRARKEELAIAVKQLPLRRYADISVRRKAVFTLQRCCTSA